MPRKKKAIRQPENQPPLDEPASASQAPGESEPAATTEPYKGFPIVGIGASAGGLAATEAFFSAMPADTQSGMAFVLVQHLAPDHKSILSDLVRRYTRMQVYEVQNGTVVKPNCTYIIPPNCDMALLNGTLQLLEPAAPRGLRLPIDFFFRSLAQDQHERAICIVLSGTGSDGTLGVRAVKGEGGMAMAQHPDSADYDGMPRSAIATSLVDYVLPPAEMPAQLVAYVTHAFGEKPRLVSGPPTKSDDVMKKICVLLRAQTGHDFSQYKPNTLARRIERRMAVHQIGRLDEYLRYVQKNPDEAEALFRDLLIGVTSFFRDPEAFAALQTRVIPHLFSGKAAGADVRLWVCGCSTGEEAYSIAILIQEHLDALDLAFKVQVFATDVDRRAIDQARGGVYPASIVADVSPERLARFFAQEADGGAYRVQRVIRNMLVFSEQDVIKDPPFSKLDLICCRNLLIYLNGDLQKKLITLFHYALRPGGMLFLGNSETVGESATFFATLDVKWKIYLRREDVGGAPHPPLGTLVPPLARAGARPRLLQEQSKTSFREVTERALLLHYAQAGVLINGRGDILHIYGRTGKYLEPAPGEAGVNIVRMAREGLRRELNVALHRAVAHKEPVRCPGLRVKTDGEFVTVNLTVQPVAAEPAAQTGPPGLFLVVLEEVPPVAQNPPDSAAKDGDALALSVDGRVAMLERELQAKEEYLQTTLEEMETSNEELEAANEEMQSVNEELQSTNEELQTSKEELQSVNEELATVNAELQDKVTDLSRANNDLNNLLAGTGIGTLFVDHQLRITRFTPPTTELINLIQADIGRPVGHVVSNLVGYDNLVKDVRTVLDSLVPKDVEVQTRLGSWYMMRIRPYRTLENVIEGAVITFADITEHKRMQADLREAALREAQTKLAEDIVATMREPLLVLDGELRVILANRSFYNTFQVEPDRATGCLLYDLGNHQWDIPALRRLLEEILPQNNSFNGFEVTHDFQRIGRRTMLLNARRVFSGTEKTKLILLAIEDITEREQKAQVRQGGGRDAD